MIHVNPDILIWARETAGLTVDAAVKKLSFKNTQKVTALEKLNEMELGQREVSKSVLDKMSKVYRRPLITFYLPMIPKLGEKVEDYRSMPSTGDSAEDNGLLNALVRDVKSRQSLVRSVLIDEDEDIEIGLYNSCCPDQGPAQVIDRIIRELDFDVEVFRKKADSKEAFKYLRGLVESIGVYVVLMGNLGSHHSNISPKVFRGFVLSDPVAPFVVINDLDAPAAWSFTLLHELAHFSFGQSGISGGDSEQKIEQLCNTVASNILLPQKDLDSLEFNYSSNELFCDSIAQQSRLLNISSYLIIYRLYLSNRIQKKDWLSATEYFEQKWQEFRARQRAKNKEQDGGPSPYILKKYKMGALVSLMKRMNASGAITATKAGKVLGTRAIKVHKLFDTI